MGTAAAGDLYPRSRPLDYRRLTSAKSTLGFNSRSLHVDWAKIAAIAIGLVLLILVVYFRVRMTHSITPPQSTSREPAAPPSTKLLTAAALKIKAGRCSHFVREHP